MARHHTDISEILGAIVGIFFLILIVWALSQSPPPIGTIFQNFLADIIIGIVAAIIIVLILLILSRRDVISF
jgi:membrane protein DedA with SNARE-associated domain